MTDRTPLPLEGEDSDDQALPPEAHNASQDDEPDQAQSIAEEALGEGGQIESAETERAPSAGGLEDDDGGVPDLVDHMNQMVTDGRIDMSAYRGERNDDDVEGALGPDGDEDEGPQGAE